ncbi:hypothetical protein, partial ['Camptotheca acuminata' phytoplasma]|uniref:hypothetical protein n=1 Tax='Camptotheca acuminata' phytoplasma TaxID=3239192 RepID=UPI00351A5389
MIYFLLFNFYIYFFNIKRKDISVYVLGYTPSKTVEISDSDMNQVIEPLTTAPTANNEPSSQIPSQTVEISDSDMNQ